MEIPVQVAMELRAVPSEMVERHQQRQNQQDQSNSFEPMLEAFYIRRALSS